MCGIAGFIHNSISIEESKIRITKMINIIDHRGPDALCAIIGKKFSMATARLAIEKIREGEQPIVDENKRYVLSFNGEIFNYKDIILKYSFPKKKVDSEIKLLAKLFELKGVNFINEIEGQFAISIYDIVNDKLYLYRDRFGIRPIYYKYQNKKFLYSSEIKSIVAFEGVTPKTSLMSIASTSLFWSNIKNMTSFKDIFQIPPGNYLIFSNGKLEIKKYWNNPISQNIKKDEIDKKFKYEKLFRLIKDAVKRQIHGEVGFSSYLSGGIDSSIIAYLLTQIQKSPIDTFSVEFENKEYDESAAQQNIKKVINSNHFSLRISNKDIAENFEKVINHSECHLFRTAPVPMFLLSKYVKDMGHKVVFTGEGADEILLGYDLFGEVKIRKFWSKFPSSAIRPKLLKKLYYYLPQFQDSRYFEITKEFYKKNLTNIKDNFYSHQIRWDQYSMIKNFFHIDDGEYKKESLENDFLKSLPKNFKNLSMIRKAQIVEINTLLSGYLLSSQGDRMTMAHGVEGRYPYLDDIFTNALAEISSEIKAPGIKLKNVLRKAFVKHLPKKVIERPKFAYQAPEARVFFDDKKSLLIVNDFAENLSKQENLKNEPFLNLIKKFKDTNSSLRMSFRENMAFIIGLSEHFLIKSASKWAEFDPLNKRYIKYVYYE